MKKNVAKALSLGLSAVTLAGSTSITAFAQEGNANPGEGNAQQGSQQVANEAESQAVADITDLNASYNECDTREYDGEEVKAGVPDQVADIAVAVGEDEDLADQSVTVIVLDEDGNVVEEDGNVVVDDDATLSDVADDAANFADDAGYDIQQAKTHIEDIKDAADGMDTAAAASQAAASDANSNTHAANVDASQAAADAHDAVVAVESDTKENAEKLITKAEGSLDKAVQTFNDKTIAYNTAKQQVADAEQDYKDAKQAYIDAKNAASADLEDAELTLSAAELRLQELEQALLAEEEVYVGSAADVLKEADAEYKSGEIDIKTYSQIIIEKFYLRGIENLANVKVDDAAGYKEGILKVTYDITDEDGAVVSQETIYLGMDYTADGVQIYEQTFAFDGEEPKTINEMEELCANEKAVKCFVKKTENEDGSISYSYKTELQYKELSDEEKEGYNLQFVKLGNWSDVVTKGKDSAKTSYTIGDRTVNNVVSEEEIATGDEATTLCYFDANGNYVKVVTNYTTKYVYTYVNGQQMTADGFESVDAAKAAAEAAYNNINNAVDKAISTDDYIKISGYYIPRYAKTESHWGLDSDGWTKVYGRDGWSIVVVSEDKPDGSEAISDEQAVARNRAEAKYWIEDGLLMTYDSEFGGFNNDWSANPTGIQVYPLAPEVNWKNIVEFFKNGNYSAIGSIQFRVTGTYNMTYDKLESSKDNKYSTYQWFKDIIHNTNNDEAFIKAFEEQAHCIVCVDIPINGSFKNATYYYIQGYEVDDSVKNQKFDSLDDALTALSAAVKTDNTSGEFVCGIDVDKTKRMIESTQNYQYYLDYVYKTTAVDPDGANYTDTNSAKAVETAVINSIKVNTKYIELINKVLDAKQAVADAKGKVKDLRDQIDALDKEASTVIAGVDVRREELQKELDKAEGEYTDAQNNLNKASDDLKAAKDAFAAKYNTTGGGSTGGGSTDYPAGTTITEPAVALAGNNADGNNTTVNNRRTRRTRNTANAQTIADPSVALAGGDGDATTPAPAPEVEKEKEQKSIADEETPLAVEDVNSLASKGWWISILLIILIIAGSIAYYKKKMDAKSTDDK